MMVTTTTARSSRYRPRVGCSPITPVTVVRVFLRSWTHPLGADPGPVLIELNLGTAGVSTNMCAEMTPGQARAVAAALLEVAASAEEGRAGLTGPRGRAVGLEVWVPGQWAA